MPGFSGRDRDDAMTDTFFFPWGFGVSLVFGFFIFSLYCIYLFVCLLAFDIRGCILILHFGGLVVWTGLDWTDWTLDCICAGTSNTLLSLSYTYHISYHISIYYHFLS